MLTIDALPDLAPYVCPQPDGRSVSVHFRPGLPADARPLHAACYSERPWRRFAAAFDRAGRRQDRGNGIWLVGVTETAVVAGGQLLLHGRLAEVADVAVAHSWRRRGVAGALLATILTIAADRGVDELEMGVLTDNLPALRLYHAHGFTRNREVMTPHGRAYILGRHLTRTPDM